MLMSKKMDRFIDCSHLLCTKFAAEVFAPTEGSFNFVDTTPNSPQITNSLCEQTR
jgi:hypothetical protein